MIEILSMISIVALFFGLSLRHRAGEIRREREVGERTAMLRGRDVTEAKSAFGEPTEIVFAASGWRLYIWKLADMEVTATVDPASVVTDAGYQLIC